MTTSIDISYWQGHPNFAQVKGAGVNLVIMKCGGGEGGKLYTDSVYVANRAAARAQGLRVGSYFFNGPVDPTAAADYQWAVCDWKAGDIVAIDVESSTGVTRWTPAQVLTWARRILAHGVPASQVAVYMSSSVTALDWSTVKALGVGLWVAQYGSNNGSPQGSPTTHGWGWVLWQYTSVAKCAGVSGNVDTNMPAAGYPPVGPTPPPAEEEDTMKLIHNVESGHVARIGGPGGAYDLGKRGDLTKIPTGYEEYFNMVTGSPTLDLTDTEYIYAIAVAQLGYVPAGTISPDQVAALAAALAPLINEGEATDADITALQTHLDTALAALPKAVVSAEGAALANG